MHALDNPIWASLSTVHRSFALGSVETLRYEATVAPFLGAGGPLVADALRTLLAPGETLYMLGARPVAPAGFRIEDLGDVHQMVCDRRSPLPEGPPVVALGETNRPEVLALTALVYPHYFRPRTMDLGRYFGIFEAGRLAAMIGERMAAPGLREVSAVCTHPDLVGRGLARRLLAHLVNDLFARGEQPFLHVSASNERALRLYERAGWRTRTMIGFWSVAAATDA